MFNIQNSIALIKDAETIANSNLLSWAQKMILLTALKDSIVEHLPGIPDHVILAREAIAGAAEAQEQGRKAQGIENPAPVAEGRPARREEGFKAQKGKAPRSQAKTQDAGSPDQTEPTTEAPEA